MAKTAKKSVKNTDITKPDEKLAVLKQENELLKHEVELLKAKKAKKTKQRSFWRSFFAGLGATVAVVAFMLFNVSYWTQKTIIDDAQFTATVAPIIKDSDVQKAIQTEITNQIFSRINVEQELKNYLPENLQFIAAPFASQVESFTNDKIGEALQSPKIAEVWATVLSGVHSQLIAYIQNPNNSGVITVNDIYKKVGDQLTDSQIGFLFGKNLPSSIGTITVAEVKWVPQARQAIEVLQKLTNQLALATIIGAIVAIGLSTRRKSMVVGLLGFSLFFMLLTLIAIRLGEWQAGTQVAAQYSAASKAIYTIVTSSLVKQTQGFAWLFAGILGVMFIASSLDWVVWLRNKYCTGLDWIFNKLPHASKNPNWLLWISHNQMVISWTLIAVMFVSFALRMPPTPDGVIAALIGSAVVVFVLTCLSSYTRVSTIKAK